MGIVSGYTFFSASRPGAAITQDVALTPEQRKFWREGLMNDYFFTCLRMSPVVLPEFKPLHL
jgi:hypothetical protein